jgi:hypothetical protein
MIIINLKGGAGNQLFQYALGRHLALKNNDALKLEIEGLDRANKVGDIYRQFALDVFNIKKEIATAEEVKSLKYPYGILSKGWRWFSFHILKKTHTLFEPSALNWTGDIFLDGFWQSSKYFEDIRNTLLEEFTLTAPFSPEASTFATKISENTAVSIHVRRGDYATNARVLKEFGVCSTEYYKKAMEHIETTVDSPTYFVFSDDIEWVKENLPVGEGAIFVTGKDIKDTEEMMLMSQCQHNIIANSSFSWWGAWLNQNNNKIVVAPTPWFENQGYDKTLIPESWTQLQK